MPLPEKLPATRYDAHTAAATAERRDINLHAAIDLVGRGCSPRLAVEILD